MVSTGKGKSKPSTTDESVTKKKDVTDGAKDGNNKKEAEPDKTEVGNDDKDGDEEKGNNNNDNNEKEKEKNEEKDDEKNVRLSKSTRLKGYITFVVASAINYVAATESDSTNTDSSFLVVPASDKQKTYAIVVAFVNFVISMCCIIVHFDSFSCLRSVWIKAFKPKSKFELGLLIFLVIWNITATWINTSIRGIAGDGKGQYNLYFSTWVMCWASLWTLERWGVAAGYLSVKSFMKEWPNRSAGWIVMFILSFADMLCILDLYMNWEEGTKNPNAVFLRDLYSNVSQNQWEWLIFITSLTIPIAAGFSLVELFRASNTDVENTKSDCENMAEGITLFVLVCAYIPTVTIATTPGGAASLVGNAYFFTWGCTVIVIETFVWWIRDWRKNIHEIIKQQEEEYKRAQQMVLAQRKHLDDDGETATNNDDSTDLEKANHRHNASSPSSSSAAADDQQESNKTKGQATIAASQPPAVKY